MAADLVLAGDSGNFCHTGADNTMAHPAPELQWNQLQLSFPSGFGFFALRAFEACLQGLYWSTNGLLTHLQGSSDARSLIEDLVPAPF